MAATEDEIFEYIPPSAAAPEDAAPPPSTEGLDTAPLVSSEEAFRAAAAGLTRDAAGRALHGGRAPQRSAFEHPRLKLARLRRETDELTKDLAAAPEAYDGRTAAALLHDGFAVVDLASCAELLPGLLAKISDSKVVVRKAASSHGVDGHRTFNAVTWSQLRHPQQLESTTSCRNFARRG